MEADSGGSQSPPRAVELDVEELNGITQCFSVRGPRVLPEGLSS
jgi:hypothetical protein